MIVQLKDVQELPPEELLKKVRRASHRVLANGFLLSGHGSEEAIESLVVHVLVEVEIAGVEPGERLNLRKQAAAGARYFYLRE